MMGNRRPGSGKEGITPGGGRMNSEMGRQTDRGMRGNQVIVRLTNLIISHVCRILAELLVRAFKILCKASPSPVNTCHSQSLPEGLCMA